MQIRRSILCFCLACSFLLPPSSFLRADGGTIRLSERKGGYQVTVFTSPTPFRAGPVDVSVFVQNAATGELVSEARVTVRASPRGRPGEAMSHAASTEAATNKLFRAAVFELSESGWWEMEVMIEAEREPIQVQFEVEAAAPPPRWLSLWPWVAWPVLVIALYGVHRFLVARQSRHAKRGAISY